MKHDINEEMPIPAHVNNSKVLLGVETQPEEIKPKKATKATKATKPRKRAGK